jgi:hypothetical protein
LRRPAPYPVTFEVIAQTGDSIQIKGQASLARLDFKVGSNSTDPKIEPAANGLVIQLVLTLKNT